MPFIVTTWPECLGCLNPATDPHHVGPPLSRRAAATLDEAVSSVQGLCGTDLMCRLQASLTPETGGTITLPDGMVIEVEPVEWTELVSDDRRSAKWAERGLFGAQNRIIAAYNAAQEAVPHG